MYKTHTILHSAKDLWGRAYRLDDWWREGGICIIGYNMFRNLSNSKNKRYKGKMKEIFQKTLLDPGLYGYCIDKETVTLNL